MDFRFEQKMIDPDQLVKNVSSSHKKSPSAQDVIMDNVLKPSYEELEQRVKKLEQELKHRDPLESGREGQRVILSEAEKLAEIGSGMWDIDNDHNMERFRATFESAGIPMAIVDLNGWIIESNSSLQKMLGYSAQDLTSLKVLEITHPKDIETDWSLAQEMFKGNRESYQIEKRYIHRDGHHIWGLMTASLVRDATGSPLFVIGMVEDITERRQWQESLIKSERKWRNILVNTPQIGITLDTQGRIVFANKHFLQLTGWTEDDIQHKDWFDTCIPEDRRSEVRDIFRIVMDQKHTHGFSNYENDLLTRKGERKTIAWSNVLTLDSQGAVQDVTCLGIDLTERKQAELDRQELQSQLLQSQKMESVGRLAGGVAHDMNNMLVGVLGYGDMLLDDPGLDDRQRKRVKAMHQAGLKCRDLVRQLLAFSRKQTMKMDILDINQVLVDFQGFLHKTIREDIHVQYALLPDGPVIKADQSQLEQVILNLVVNAQDAMPDGGNLWIETGVVDVDERFASKNIGVVPGRYVLMVFKDTGLGMDKETLERIFEPFYTTKEEGLGTGLGLSMVYGIVKQHQGNILVHSEPGQGTTVTIHLPAHDTFKVEERRVFSKAAQDTCGQETVLVVEDNDMVREFAVNVLQEQGYTVLQAANGSQSLEMLKALQGSLDLLLTDVIMPDMNGKRLYDEIRKQRPETRVLYMSGYTKNVISHHGVLEEGVAFIPKPFSVQDLCLRVREVLDQERR